MSPAKRYIGDSGAWRPDVRASMGMAFAAALVAMAGFIALFSTVAPLKLSSTAPSVREELLLAEPTHTRPRSKVRASALHPLLPVQLPELQRMPPPLPEPARVPESFSVQDYLDERAKDAAAGLRDQVMGTDLKHKLGNAAEQQALPDNQSYQTVDGQKVVRSGGGCAQIQTVQGSSSPTNRIGIAEPIGCPGGSHDASQQMGKALDDWAKQVRLSKSPPPA